MYTPTTSIDISLISLIPVMVVIFISSIQLIFQSYTVIETSLDVGIHLHHQMIILDIFDTIDSRSGYDLDVLNTIALQSYTVTAT